RARAGDETAFSQLVERHSPWLFRRIVHLLRDEYLAHDAMQQVWLRCYLSLDEIRLVSALPAWLARVAHNQCVSDLRRLSSHQFSATSLLGSL
ncbi:MAG TPA: sigma factor, partial [Ktedonobacterales bacterium]|nr:sigma factor [Ktedonobacterales bacterium]